MRATLQQFQKLWYDLDGLRQLTSRIIDFDPARVAHRSRETTTHYKWLLVSDPATRARVWLHEFKAPSERRDGYAISIHNHRYAFNAIILSGGYTNARYHVEFDNQSLVLEGCRMLERDVVPEAATYSMDPAEYHRIESIEDGTQTLVMEFAAASIASFSVDESEGRMLRHVPVEARADGLRSLSGRLKELIHDRSDHVPAS
jgi:hypothetical protein